MFPRYGASTCQRRDYHGLGQHEYQRKAIFLKKYVSRRAVKCIVSTVHLVGGFYRFHFSITVVSTAGKWPGANIREAVMQLVATRTMHIEYLGTEKRDHIPLMVCEQQPYSRRVRRRNQPFCCRSRLMLPAGSDGGGHRFLQMASIALLPFLENNPPPVFLLL